MQLLWFKITKPQTILLNLVGSLSLSFVSYEEGLIQNFTVWCNCYGLKFTKPQTKLFIIVGFLILPYLEIDGAYMYLISHVVFLQDLTCLIIIVSWTVIVYCANGSVVTHRKANVKDASSRLGYSRGPFALPKNCLQCMCTYIYNRYMYVCVCVYF